VPSAGRAGTVLGTAVRFRGTAIYARRLLGERRVPFHREEHVRELADARARAIADYAAEHVPYYRGRFRLGEIRGVADLAELPLLEKAAVREEPAAFRSSAPDAADGLSLRTTGSTWDPLTVFHDRRSLLLNIAFAERERAVETRFVGRSFRYVALDLGFRQTITTPQEVRAFYDRSCYRPLRPRHHSVGVDESLEHVVATMDRLRPDVVRGYGTYLELLFRTAELRGLELHRPRVVVYTADGMTDEGRRLVEERFGVPVLSQYSAVEVFRIGYFCEERRAHHVHEDLCALSIVGADGRPLPDGEAGEVVVSNLVNRGSVLLNYRLGDVARIVPGRCSCGRTSRLLSVIEGRVSHIVHLRDGSFVHPLAVWAALKLRPEVVRSQLVQHEPDRFELRLQTVDRAAFDAVVAAVVPEVRKTLRGAAVEPTHHERLEQGRGGKFSPVLALPEGVVVGARGR
jgi:phenylacetate-CoA ligase